MIRSGFITGLGRARVTTDLDFVWGTVVTVSPLTVRIDGDTDAVSPNDALIDPLSLTVGDRVRCEWSGQRLIVHGASGGVKPLIGQIPSAVVVGSGSASVAVDGTVTFTGASSVSLNDVFDGLGADCYEVTAYFQGGYSTVRLRKAGVDFTAANYELELHYLDQGAANNSTGTTTATGWIHGLGSSNATPGWIVASMLLSRPKIGLYPQIVTRFTGRNSAASVNRIANVGGILANVTTGFDGFTFFPDSGTMTGWVKVVKVA